MDPRGPGGGKNDDWLTVVGEVKDMRGGGPERRPIAQIYEPQVQRGEQPSMFLVRTARDPAILAPAVRAVIRDVNPAARISFLRTVEDLLSEEWVERRFETWLVGVFSAVALVLAALGVFAVMHFAVVARTREIGVRVAVGARAADIVGLVIRDGARLALLGIALGTLASAWASDALTGILFEVKPTDPASFIGAAVILGCVAIAACYPPARRAARLDAVTALREE
jgi:putative ABC transport system permease protein